MAKVVLVLSSSAILVVFHVFLCSATVYTVGENSGWDISTDLDSWSKDKTFSVSDTLFFQYSQYHSLSELTKENFEGCNTTNVLQSYNNGNTTIALTSPGDRYFACGNRLHCLGGMKLHINVVPRSLAESPAGAPEAEPQPGGALPPGSSKANGQPNSAISDHIRMNILVRTLFGALAVLLGLI